MTLSSGRANDLLTRNPSIATLLQQRWQAGSFKEVRQLGTLPFCALTSLAYCLLEILWPGVQEPRHPQRERLTQSLLRRVSTQQSQSGLYNARLFIDPQTKICHVVTMRSWDIDYVGDTSHLLSEHLASYPGDEGSYARYTSIVQSSGTGKSRAIDELSKTHLVVPLNLRQESKGNFLRISQPSML